MKGKTSSLVRTMAEVAIFGALGYVLDFFASAYSRALFVNGGSIGVALACVFFMSFRRGTLAGVFTGLVIGLLEMTEGVMIAPSAAEGWKAFIQVGLDYWLAYPLAGFAGLFHQGFAKSEKNGTKVLFLSLGCLWGGLLKFLSHYFSGIFFWPDDPWNVGGKYIYSFLYNGAYVFPSLILSLAALIFLFYRLPNAFDPSLGLLKLERKTDAEEETKEAR